VKRRRPSVPRETLAALTDRYELPEDFPDRIERLLEGLEREPDPHTTVSRALEALDVHVADSLAALGLPAVRGAARIADVGAGAGFPGLVLAAALPGARVDLIESAGRKAQVIERLAVAAGLSVGVLAMRAEEWAAADGAGAYDLVTARAVAPLPVLAEYAAPLLAAGGALVAWKGARSAAEEAAGAAAASQLGLDPGEIVPVMPYAGSRNRHLYVYLKVGDTPARFPRRAGMAAKKPLK
jgi:16S rRNA (guanine527-N7)-methyltransferase